ncbi:hypothetical protein ZTR_05257 [Talaromyces verruculosus]|nr:hypothetical protein ZTR_05257 [Talaromyces verruculosus]
MKIKAVSSLGIALVMFLTGTCSALPETSRDRKVQVPDLSINPYAVTTVLDSVGSALNSRSNESLDLDSRDRRKSIKLHLSPKEDVTGAATPAQS